MNENNGLVPPYTDRNDHHIVAHPALAALPRPSPGAIQVCTLGGVADIGMNWTLYGFDDSYLLVDAGSSFAPRDVPGVEAVFPDPTLIKTLGKRLLGLVVTHFHEDHVGAIHRVWPRFARCPVYAPPFASQMLANRFAEAGTQGRVVTKTFTPGNDLRIGPFHVRTIPVAHSTPDCVALAIRAGRSVVLHTGDWKVDDTPGIGYPTDFRKFARLGASGVDLMLCDSTNADREVPPTSESSVERAMTKVFRRAKGMVVVCSFGSNVARMASVAKASANSQRKVALSGRSLRNAEEVATNCGLLGSTPKFLDDPKDLKGFDRRKRVLMCTGTQGEENASLTRLAERSNWRLPPVEPGDVVIHSARVIPGNEDYVYPVLQKLREQGAEIMMADASVEGDPLHVTGHPCRSDLRRMYDAVRPRIAMPVHGSPSHLAAHARLAAECGVRSVLAPVIGGVYELRDGALTTVGRMVGRYVAVMGDGTMVGWSEGESRPVPGDAARLDEVAPPLKHRFVGGRSRDVRARRDGASRQERPRQDRPEGRRPDVPRVEGRDETKGPHRRDRDGRKGGGGRTDRRDRAGPVVVAAPMDRSVPGPSLALDLAFIERMSGNHRDGGNGARRPRP